MGTKDKKKTIKSLAHSNVELVEKDNKLEMKKRKGEKASNGQNRKVVPVSVEVDDSAKAAKGKRKTKLSKKGKVKKEKNFKALEGKHDHPNTESDDDFEERNGKSKKSKKKKRRDRNSLEGGKSMEKAVEAGQENCSKGISSISKKASKKKKRDLDSSKSKKTLEREVDADQDDVYLISSGDGDCARGMKKWITEYHQSRPGLKVLQQRIDEFIVAHDEKIEQERKDKEARAAEGGWTVVAHHKGRKKTTDAESGITVGSVSQAVVEDKVAKKKRAEVGLDFYRFQRKEAQRNEIMMLQSKFEQDKKRIQQLRAGRKFRPY